MTVSSMIPPTAPSAYVGNFGQFWHLLPPLIVKSTISEVLRLPLVLSPVVTKTFETFPGNKNKK